MHQLERRDPDRARIFGYGTAASTLLVAGAVAGDVSGAVGHARVLMIACVATLQLVRVALNVAGLAGFMRMPPQHQPVAVCIVNSVFNAAIGHLTHWPSAALLLLPLQLVVLQGFAEDASWRRFIPACCAVFFAIHVLDGVTFIDSAGVIVLAIVASAMAAVRVEALGRQKTALLYKTGQLGQQTTTLLARTAELEARKRELEASQVELLQAQKLAAIGQLASGIAHELNTPVQYVTDNTLFLERSAKKLFSVVEALQAVVADPTPELLADANARAKKAKLGYLADEIPKAIKESLEGLARVTSIVRAMKDFSHPSMGVRVPVQLKEAVETTVTVARNEWRYVADVDVRVPADLPAVPALRDELNQVILNLVVNAAHAIEEKHRGTNTRGTITIEGRSDADNVELLVTDDGCGIPDAVRARIFDPFFTTKPIGKGTGQGLAIARAVVVEKHGGTLGVESTPGVGTTFAVRLPLAAPQ